MRGKAGKTRPQTATSAADVWATRCTKHCAKNCAKHCATHWVNNCAKHCAKNFANQNEGCLG